MYKAYAKVRKYGTCFTEITEFCLPPNTNHTWIYSQLQHIIALWMVFIAPDHRGMVRLCSPA